VPARHRGRGADVGGEAGRGARAVPLELTRDPHPHGVGQGAHAPRVEPAVAVRFGHQVLHRSDLRSIRSREGSLTSSASSTRVAAPDASPDPPTAAGTSLLSDPRSRGSKSKGDFALERASSCAPRTPGGPLKCAAFPCANALDPHAHSQLAGTLACTTAHRCQHRFCYPSRRSSPWRSSACPRANSCPGGGAPSPTWVKQHARSLRVRAHMSPHCARAVGSIAQTWWSSLRVVRSRSVPSGDRPGACSAHPLSAPALAPWVK